VGVVMAKGKLKIEGRRREKIQMGFLNFAQKSVMNLITRKYQVVQKFQKFYCIFFRLMCNF